MKNIRLAIPTYNGAERTINLIESIYQITNPEDLEKTEIIVLDDGTPYKEPLEELEEYCESFNIPLIRHKENMGIPVSWNDLVKYGTDNDIEYCILLNDDVIIKDGAWVRAGLYFHQNNPNIGTIGWPLIQIEPNTGKPIDGNYENSWGTKPGVVGSPVGTCFMFRKDVWAKVKNPDGTTGFFEGLRNFHEEIHFSFKLWELGYTCWMLPWPGMEHWSSRTFSLNSELTWTKFDSRFGTKKEYWDVIKESTIISDDWKKLAKEKLFKEGIVDCMSFSRWVFSKTWQVLDRYDNPCQAVDEKLVDRESKRKIKWLDKESKVREEEL